MTSTFGMVVRSLSLVVLSLLLVSCSSKYGSKYEAEIAKGEWIAEGGFTMEDTRDDCAAKNKIRKDMGEKLLDCRINYTKTKHYKRRCINEKETNQYVCMEMKQDGFDYTYFKY